MAKTHTLSDLVVGMTVHHGDEDWLGQYNQNYLNVLNQYGVSCIILAPDRPAILPDGTVFTPDSLGRLDPAVLQHLDGLILSGGGDVHPEYFNQPIDGAEPQYIDRARDELELGLSRAALAQDMPVFGICRGCQVLNVAAGGSMRQHFDGHRSPSRDDANFHDVSVTATGLLYRIIEDSSISVNTFHHQGMDEAALAPVFRPLGWAQPDDWLVEAYDSPEHRWVLGVQWHPERLFELSEDHHRIWDSFFESCLEHRRA